MPEANAGVKDQRNQGLLVGLHNGRVWPGLLAFPAESTGVDGAYSPPELGASTRAAAVAASRVVPREGILSSLQQRMSFDQASCNEEEVPMASYTIEIPDGLHHEIQERRHRIDVADICTQALTAAVAGRHAEVHPFGRGHEVTEAINRMFSG